MENDADYGFDEDFALFTNRMQLYFEATSKSLVAIASEPPLSLLGDEKQVLEQARSAVLCGSTELRIVLDAKLQRPIDRGDVYHHVEELIEAAFIIGKYAGSTERAERHARRQMQSAAGKARAQKRREEGERWKKFCFSSARQSRASNSGISKEDMASRMLDRWPAELAPKPVRGTLTAYIKQLEDSGDIPKKETK